jgi:Pyruvate/2-oxoglutarate dehydrogenase complex, dihydrolipoamide acyltransferase (E2) component, and related enzymes
VAVDTPHGLLVPVIRDVDKKGILALAQELQEVSERARARKLSPEERLKVAPCISSGARASPRVPSSNS